MSSLVLDPPSTKLVIWKKCYQSSLPQGLNQLTQGALRLPPWVRLRESKFLSQRKRQRNGNTYSPCQTATPPHNLLPLSSHPLKAPFFLGPLLHHQGKSFNKSKLPKLNALGRNIISSTDFSKDKMSKVWKSFRTGLFLFWQSRLTNTDRVSFAYLTSMLW